MLSENHDLDSVSDPTARALRPLCSFVLLAAVSFNALFSMASLAASDQINFNLQILPVLSENCFYCHGPDPGHRKAKLRLDDEADAKRDRNGEAVIVPGKSAQSLILARLQSLDPDEHMPPASSHKQLD